MACAPQQRAWVYGDRTPRVYACLREGQTSHRCIVNRSPAFLIKGVNRDPCAHGSFDILERRAISRHCAGIARQGEKPRRISWRSCNVSPKYAAECIGGIAAVHEDDLVGTP